MAAEIISGKEIAKTIREELKTKVDELLTKGITPGLGVILVGEDPASHVYVKAKGKACDKLGIYSDTIKLPAETSEDEILKLIDRMNNDPKIHGILVQLPLPKHINENKVLMAIDPDKDVDGFHPVNVGRMLVGDECFLPCTPHGVQELLIRSGNDPEGKHVVIVGRSNIVGKPVAGILMQKKPGANATVTIAHSRTKNLPEITKTADILVAAIGKPEFIKADMVKEGVVIIDVGVNQVGTTPEGKRILKGDVEFEAVSEKAKAITPVPGGVGPMTITMLMQNTVKSAQRTVGD
ncbi:MAG: bifunctional methylenetetrahydrofolate dehydrogenase/methenyltetrahydrofolate cyclohydrolase FolD [Thermoplasmata archaeon]|nr:MAG: bifunctional methylenetetrahydrofolate dehydrogenase/methenyltetrahydrofolate cyclohydrolase FolD [Thermoplasmata archaeon]